MSSIDEELKHHRNCVKKIANELVEEGYSVQAHLDGFEFPDLIGPTHDRRIPDIIAKTNSLTLICEVETESTIKSHRHQWEVFKKYAEETDSVTFWLIKATEKGECQLVNSWSKKN